MSSITGFCSSSRCSQSSQMLSVHLTGPTEAKTSRIATCAGRSSSSSLIFVNPQTDLKNVRIQAQIQAKQLPFLCFEEGKPALQALRANIESFPTEALLASGRKFPVVVTRVQEDFSKVAKILRNESDPLRALLIREWQLTPETIALLMEIDTVICTLIEKEQGKYSLTERFEQVCKLHSVIETLRATGFDQIDRLSSEIQVLMDIIVPFLEGRKEHSETELERLSRAYDDLLFLLMLDKAVEFVDLAENLGGGREPVLRVLAQAAEEVCAEMKSQSRPDSLEKTLLFQFFDDFSLALRTGVELSDNFYKWAVAADRFIECVKQAKVGFPVMASTGISGHAQAFSVQKNENGTYKLVMYNTGDGVNQYHHRLDRHYFQTYLVMDQVPEKEALSHRNIYEMLQGDNCFRDSQHIYEAFNQWGKSGVKHCPSLDPEEYERNQQQGTCRAQSIMAFIRYYAMDWFKGSPHARLGFYKEVKAQLLNRFAVDRLPRAQPVIRRAVERKMIKLQHDVELLQLAKDLEAFNSAMSYLKQVLSLVPALDEIERLLKKTVDSPHEKMMLLHGLIREMGYVITSDQLSALQGLERPAEVEVIWKGIVSRYDYRVSSIAKALGRLDRLYAAKSYDKSVVLLVFYIVDAPLVDRAVREWTRHKIENDGEFYDAMTRSVYGQKLLGGRLRPSERSNSQ